MSAGVESRVANRFWRARDFLSTRARRGAAAMMDQEQETRPVQSRMSQPAGAMFQDAQNTNIQNATFNIFPPSSAICDSSANVEDSHREFPTRTPPLFESATSPTTSAVPTLSLSDRSGSDSSLPDASPAAPSEIYRDRLQRKNLGHPLWIPGPNERLSEHYRETGVMFGDVGVITAHGSFSYLFSIVHQATHPRNAGVQLPPNFVPFAISPNACEIEEFREFDGVTSCYLADDSVIRMDFGENSSITLRTSAKQAAILALPEAVYTSAMLGVVPLRGYISINLQSWYSFARYVKGWDVKNGDIRVVQSSRKSSGYGMAIVSNGTSDLTTELIFSVHEPHPDVESCKYRWRHKGSATVKAGPSTSPGGLQRVNQCLFVGTIDCKLGDEQWKAVEDGDVSLLSLSRQQDSNLPGQSGRRSRGECSTSSGDSSSGHSSSATPSSWSSSYLLEGLRATNEHPNTLNNKIPVPSDILADILLQAVPGASVVSVCTQDWGPYYTDSILGISEFVASVLSANDICEDNGIAYLQKKPQHSIEAAFPNVSHPTSLNLPAFPNIGAGPAGNVNPGQSVPRTRQQQPSILRQPNLKNAAQNQNGPVKVDNALMQQQHPNQLREQQQQQQQQQAAQQQHLPFQQPHSPGDMFSQGMPNYAMRRPSSQPGGGPSMTPRPGGHNAPPFPQSLVGSSMMTPQQQHILLLMQRQLQQQQMLPQTGPRHPVQMPIQSMLPNCAAEQRPPNSTTGQQIIENLKSVFLTQAQNKPPVDMQHENRVEFNAILEGMNLQATDMEAKVALLAASLVGTTSPHTDTLRKWVDIVMNVAVQRQVLSNSAPRYFIDLPTLKNMNVEFGRYSDAIQTIVAGMTRQAQQLGPQAMPPHEKLQQMHIQAQLANRLPMGQPPHHSAPMLPQQSGMQQPMPPGPHPPQHQLPPQQWPPTQPHYQFPAPGQPLINGSLLQPPAQPLMKRKPSSASMQASTPATRAPTPTATASSPPAGVKSPKTRPTPKAKPAAANQRRLSKAAPPKPSAAAPAVEQSPSPSGSAGSKRAREDDTPDSATPSTSSVAAEQSPPKRSKTEWESEPTTELKKEDLVAVENLKTKLDIFLKGIPSTSDLSARFLMRDPSGSGLQKESLPPPDFSDQFFDFSDFSAGGEEDFDLRVPTPDLVSSVSSTNPSPESNFEDAAHHALAASTFPEIKSEDRKDLDSSEAMFFQPTGWDWDAAMPSLDPPWAI